MFNHRAENLSRLIADPTLIDRETIEYVIAVAKETAAAGYPLQLVELDDILDIAQIFSFRTPQLAHLATKPTIEAASDILAKLQAKLEITDSSVWKDPVWTARVAAVLAYFSSLE